MVELTKMEILEVMSFAGEYQREVFRQFSIELVDVTKYKNGISIVVHYVSSVVSYKELFSMFRRYFDDYREFINVDGCYSNLIRRNERSAHFSVRFYA